MDFYHHSTRWGGSAATIVPSDKSKVWGAIWEIGMENLANLDKQEGVQRNVYKPLTVEVTKRNEDKVECRTYQLVNLPPKLQKNQEIPYDRLPSKTYLDTIIQGAKETGLPKKYVASLEKIPHNDNLAEQAYKDKMKKNKTKPKNRADIVRIIEE